MKTTIQNPKPEIRSPKEIRNPKSEEPRPTQRSGSGLRASFGFRNAAFGFLLLLSTLNLPPVSAHAQGTTFTYQGRLNDGGAPANGSYNLTFTLFTNSTGGTAVAGPVTNSAVAVSNGLFTVVVDFGAAVWNGATNWLQIGVETNGGSSFTTLSPRQEVTPVPYAITAENLDGTLGNGGLSGTYGNVVNLNNAGNQFTGSYSGNGAGLTNVNAFTLGGLPAGSFWQLGGNANVPAGSNVIGTLGNQFLDIRANGVRVMRLRLMTDGMGYYTNAPNVIGGSSVNLTAANVVGAAIAGGGGQDTNGISYPNAVGADFGAIGGGQQNVASGIGATVTGGELNTASGPTASVNGGDFNTASGNTAAVGGGFVNTASGAFATVAGGGQNIASNTDATVSGGAVNLAGGAGSFVGGGGYDGSSYAGNTVLSAAGTIGGGLGNTINTVANYSFIGGGGYNQIFGDFNNKGGSAIVGGGNNLVSSNAAFSFIGGGLANQIFGDANDNGSSVIVGGYANMVLTNSVNSFIGGGDGNIVGSNAPFSTIGGGLGNSIVSGATYAFIGGGISNTATGISSVVGGGGYDGEFNFPNGAAGKASVIGGGIGNTNTSNAEWATIGGGIENTCSDTGATVCGGDVNTASGQYSTVCGGAGNSATGTAGFAAGYFARSLHDDTFVWSDGTPFPNFSSTAINQFLIYASGGVGIGTNGPTAQLQVTSSGGNSFPQAQLDQQNASDYSRLRFTIGGNQNKRWDLAATTTNFAIFSGSIGANMIFLDSAGLTVHGTFVSSSDRNAKEHFQPIDPRQTLEKVAALPITTWNYKDDPATHHLGPMAQDFYAAFQVGTDDKHIATVDEEGVALAAIQGLNRKLEDGSQKSEVRIQMLETENADLKARLEKLEQLINSVKGNSK